MQSFSRKRLHLHRLSQWQLKCDNSCSARRDEETTIQLTCQHLTNNATGEVRKYKIFDKDKMKLSLKISTAVILRATNGNQWKQHKETLKESSVMTVHRNAYVHCVASNRLQLADISKFMKKIFSAC